MHVAIANYNPPNHEKPKVRELFPVYLRESAANLISFMEQYYEYMNQEGAPSYELGHLISEGDIDATSAKYLDAIQREVARVVPNSDKMDRATLYKRIVHYYRIKGTPDSIEVFFQMMFDSLVDVYYPGNDLLKLSAGQWDSSTSKWIGRSGFLSNSDKIQDSEYWQDFSYQIRTEIPPSKWSDEFTRLVHPAGMRFFVITSLIAKATGLWDEYIDYNQRDWKKYLKPIFLRSRGFYEGSHSPKYQPGWFSTLISQEIIAIANNFFTDTTEINPSNLSRSVEISKKLVVQSVNFRAQYVHDSYFLGENKYNPIFWKDARTLKNTGYMNTPISDLIVEYSPTAVNLSNPYGTEIDITP